MNKVNQAVELRDKASELLAALAQLGMISQETKAKTLAEVRKNLAHCMTEIVNNDSEADGQAVQVLDKSAPVSEVKQPVVASAALTGAGVGTVLDSPSAVPAGKIDFPHPALKSANNIIQADGPKKGPVGFVIEGADNHVSTLDPVAVQKAKADREAKEDAGYTESMTNARPVTNSNQPHSEEDFSKALEDVHKMETDHENRVVLAVLKNTDKDGEAIELKDDQDIDERGAQIVKGLAPNAPIDEKHPGAMVCPYWLESLTSETRKNHCTHEDDHPPFFHSILAGRAQEPLECQFWLEDRCFRASQCPYAHYKTRHGLVKKLSGNPFTIQGDPQFIGERGLADSRYAHSSKRQAYVKAAGTTGTPGNATNAGNTEGTKNETDSKAALDNATAKFQAHLNADRIKTGRVKTITSNYPGDTVNPLLRGFAESRLNSYY